MKEECVSLYYKEGSSDKVYNASLLQKSKGWVVEFSYGRRGSALNAGSKTPTQVGYPAAKKIYDKLVLEKTCKGYKAEESTHTMGSVTLSPVDTGLRPQLLNEISAEEVESYIKNPEFCAQQKYDGRNRLLFNRKYTWGGTNRKGQEIEVPEKVGEEVQTLPIDTVLAGEAIDDYVMCFDLISMKDKSFKERDHALKELLKGKKKIIPVYTAWTETTKRNLYNELKDAGEEGIVFKHKDAHFTPGRPASGGSHLKFKFVDTASVFVTDRNSGKRSVVMGIYNGKDVETIGSVTVYPNQDIPNIGDVIEVKYLYAYKGGSLFQPVLLGVRDDVDQKDCTIDQLKYKKED